MKVLERASRILDAQENLPSEDCPPDWMWLCDEELEIWFGNIYERRKAGLSSQPDDEEPEMMQNELAKNYR